MLVYLFKKNKKLFIKSLIFLLLFSLSRPVFSKLIIYYTDLSKLETGVNIGYLLLPGLLYLLGYFLVNLFSEKYLDKFMIKCKQCLNEGVYESLLDIHGLNFDKSYLTSIFTNDIDQISNDYIQGLTQIVYFIVSFLGASLVIYSLSGKILLYLIVISTLTFIIQKLLANTLADKQYSYNTKFSKIIKILNESIDNIREIKIYNLEDKFRYKFKKASIEANEELFRLNLSEDMVEVVNQTSASLIEVGLYIVGVVLIIDGKLTISELLAIVVSCDSITLPIYAFSRTYAKFAKTKKTREKLIEIINGSNTSKGDFKISTIDKIRVDDYACKYDLDPISDSVSFSINYGEKILIVGENGSGKSTLISSMLDFSRNHVGDIFINGMNVKNIDKESYYKRISFLGQRYILTEDTIRNNIIGNEVYLEEKYNRIIDGLNIKNFDKSNMVNENRDNLSGGEMQKISIARAIYKDSDILILDEPFSSLDRKSVDKILDILLRDNRSVIVIAHNLNRDKINKFDKVVHIKRKTKYL